MVGICGQGALLLLVAVMAVSGLSIQARLAALESLSVTLETDLAAANARLDAVRANQTRRIGFTVRKPAESASPNHRMNFTFIQTNEGSAWNATSATFKAPVAGTYYFHASLLKLYVHTDYARCRIYKNGVSTVTAYVNPGNDPKHGHHYLGNGVYESLAVNDTVTLEDCITPIATVFHEHSAFSGFLITPKY